MTTTFPHLSTLLLGVTLLGATSAVSVEAHAEESITIVITAWNVPSFRQTAFAQGEEACGQPYYVENQSNDGGAETVFVCEETYQIYYYVWQPIGGPPTMVPKCTVENLSCDPNPFKPNP